MAVPSSGTLTMLGLAREKVYNNYSSTSTPTAPYSLYDLVRGGNTNGSGTSFPSTNTMSPSYPSSTTPYEMSDWYGYDNDYSSLTSFSSGAVASTGNLACAQGAPTNTYYHDGSGSFPAVGDNVYTNAFGTTALGNGTYKISTNYMVVSSGAVTQVNVCR